MERSQLNQQQEQQQCIPPQRHRKPRRSNMPVATTKTATAVQAAPHCEKVAKVPQQQQQEQHNLPQPQQQQLQQQQQQPHYQNGSEDLLNCQCQKFLNPFPESK